MKKAQLFSICTIVLALLGIILYMFLKAANDFTGLEVMFGAKAVDWGIIGKVGLKFSFLLFLGFTFAIAGLVITILPMAGVKLKLFPIIAIALFVVAAVFAFLSTACCVSFGESGIFGAKDTAMGLKDAKLGAGAIIAGILYICAAVTSALPVVLKDK